MAFLLRVSVRVAKYEFGDGTLQVMRRNTCGTEPVRTGTMPLQIDNYDDVHKSDEEDEAYDLQSNIYSGSENPLNNEIKY